VVGAWDMVGAWDRVGADDLVGTLVVGDLVVGALVVGDLVVGALVVGALEVGWWDGAFVTGLAVTAADADCDPTKSSTATSMTMKEIARTENMVTAAGDGGEEGGKRCGRQES